jgi:hypothetical protein
LSGYSAKATKGDEPVSTNKILVIVAAALLAGVVYQVLIDQGVVV